MNSIKKFMEIFESKRTSESWSEMTAILKECHQYFKNVPASERGVVLSILFVERKGLLAFLMEALERQYINKNLEGTIIQLFQLLTPIINQFSNEYKPYLSMTMAALKLALTIKSSYYLKDAAAKTFVEFIIVFKSLDLDFNTTVNDWVKKMHLYSISERRLILHVISVITSYFPQTEAFVRSAKIILRQLIADCTDTYEGTKKKSLQSWPTYIEALNNILRNFPPSDEDIGTSIGPDKLYRIIKNLCNSKENQNYKKLMLVVVNLLSEHLSLFDEYVYEDYEFWHIMLGSFVKKGIYDDTAIKALRNYYRTVGKVLGRKNSSDDKKVFLNLRDSFVKSLSDGRICSTELRLTVYGFSQIIEPCKNYLAEAGVEEMFSLIAHRTIPLYSREDDETARFEEIADYQEALSRIIRYLENVSIDQIRALTTLCSLMIKRFPELSITDQQYATSSLNRTIINVRYTKEILYQDFIKTIIYDGVVWSCSHMLLIDAEHKRDADETTKHLITYKDYVPLWRGLLNPENYSSASENSDTRASAIRLVVDEIVTTCINLINTLNLNVTSRNNNSVFYDAKLSQTPENKTDFRIFLNLVDLYVDVLPNIENFLWSEVIEKFIYEIIKNSYKNPLISGFYKLANVTLASSGAFVARQKTHETLSNESFNLVLQYLWNTIDALPRYPQELQISCLHLVLNVPETFVPRIVDRAVSTFRISLTLGLTNYEIATAAMTALEHWHVYLGGECTKNFISQIVPCLEMFLQSDESSERLLQDIEETRRRRRRSAKTVATLVNDEKTVEGFQKRILLFFGSLDSEIMSEYIHRRSLKTGATWSKKDLLKYPMPFPDKSCDIDLDSMLPRIIELALGSGDRRTRVAASEVLHTIVAFMLGKTVNFLAYDKDHYSLIYEKLCPALLRLGCDSDDVIMQLYHPLMMQLTHWLSSRLMLDSVSTIHLVDALFDGLSDETNSSLREVSGIYLAEFLHWSIKQSSDKSLARCPTNIDLIVRRIIDFAHDPSSRKRVAAAIAFNHLYRIIRENEEIVSIFWLAILQAFVKSLDGCQDTRIDDSLRHVERVFVEKSRIFNETSTNRIQPPGFTGVKIIDAVEWLFQQCGTLDRNCRRRCMKIFENLSPIVDTANTSKAIIIEYIKCYNMRGLNDILIGNTGENFSTTTSQGLTVLQKTLDLYVWLIRDNLIDNDILFTSINPENTTIFNRIDDFIVECLVIAKAVIVENSASDQLQEFVKLRSQRCESVVTLFDFILVILDVKEIKPDHIPDSVFSENFFSLVSVCLTKPNKLGFDSSNLQLTEQLPDKLEQLVKKIIEILSAPLVTLMKNTLSREIEKFSAKLFQLDEMTRNKVFVSQTSINGLIILQKCEILVLCGNCRDIPKNATAKIEKIFDLLRSEDLGKSVCFYPKLEMRMYLRRLVELLLIDYDSDTIKLIVKLVTNTTELYRSDMTIVTHGEYFFSTFKSVITRGFLANFEKTLIILENSLREKPDNVLGIIEAIVLYLQRNRGDYREIIEKSADMIIAKFNVFVRSINNLDHRRNVFLNIYATVVRIKRKQLLERDSDIYRWILLELVSCNSFKQKIRLIRDFLVCLTDETSDDNPELAAILGNLKNERKITNSELTSDNRRASTETTDCFQNLLKLLPITRSPIVLDAIINFSSGAGDVLCENKVNEYLELYYNAVGAPNVLKSLNITYKRFMTLNDTNERFDVLRYFLLPSLGQCAPQMLEKFFELNTREIYEIIVEKATLNVHDRKQLFVSKIASYNLMEIMFANLPRDRIDSKDSPITIDKRTSGRSNDDEKFSRKIFRSTLPVRQLRSIDGDDCEIVRLVHCSAYKCCIAIVSMTRDEKFYLAVFGENRDKNQLIWENIIDVGRKYDLRQTSKEYPKEREKLVNIRKTVSSERNDTEHYSYVKSYDLATSTLSDNICAYDLNAVNLLPRTSVIFKKNDIMSLTLEIDDLNDHECMPLICGLLKHMLENEISRPGNDEIVMPKWMSQFRASMWSEHANVRLFMLKIVLNTQAIFRPYAKFFLEPVINAIYQCLKEENSLNYVITDALIMLIDWREIYVPETERGKNLARLMFAFLVEKSIAAPMKYIVRYNMSIIEMIVDSWHECLVIPESLDERMSRDDRTAMKLVLIFLTNKMAEKIVVRKDIWDYVKKCLEDWKIEEETILQTYEAAGLMIKYSIGMEHYDSRKSEIIDIVSNVLRNMQSLNPGRLVKCVHSLCKACHELATDFFQFVSSIQLRVEPMNIVKCLEIFSLVLPKLSRENIVKELSYMRFNNLLENKVLSCEKICLRVVDQLVEILETQQLLQLVKLVATYSSDENLDYRRLCYDIFAKLYKKYSSTVSEELETSEIMNISKRVLLSGLLDPSEEMQKFSLNFWSDMTTLREKCCERFLDILDTYSCGVETNFLQIVTLVLLELTRKSVNCEKKMFEPLHNCSYNDHDISISWKSRNYESRIPLYAPSLASHLNQRFTQYSYAMGTSSCNERDSQENFVLRSTEAPNFETTYLSLASMTENSSDDISENGIFVIPKIPVLSRNKVSRRFLADWSDVNVRVRKKQEMTKFSELEYRREYLARQRGRVKLYRKYRIGDFPDIEISHSMILGPMQELVKRDPQICKNLMVTLVRGIIDQTIDKNESEAYRAEISARFTRILSDERQNNGAVAAILEILFNVSGLECPWSIVANVATNDGLYAQGAILMEQSLIRETFVSEPPAKRARIVDSTENNAKKERWIELAGLYESMNELDVVLGIFRGDMFSEELHSASLARSANDWTRAEEFYRKALQTEIGEQTKRHCLQGSFECLSRLGKWKKLENDIDARLNGNFNDLLSLDPNQSQWMTPWIFRTHTQRILEARGNEKFVNAMKTYLGNTTYYQRLKENYGEETAVILCTEKPEISRDFLNGSWEKIRQKWLRLSPLAVPLRSRTIVKLRGIHDIDSYLRIIDNSDIPEGSRELTNHWKNSVPSVKDDLLAWDIHASYRSYFCENLIRAIGTNESQESIDLVNDIRSVKVQQMLKIIDCSLSQRNGQLAKKYLLRVEPELNNCSQNHTDEFDLCAIRFKFLEAETACIDATSLKHYSSVWKQSQDILRSDSLSLEAQIAVRQIISNVSRSLGKIANERGDFFENLAARTSIVRDIFSERIDFDNVGDSLNYYSFTNLQKCCILDQTSANCHLRLSKYCYERISSGNCDDQLSREFVRSTLGAMSRGSVEATYYFPCLLKENILSNDEICQIFHVESARVETWRFLIWQTQLLSHLGTKLSKIVMPIVRRMIDSYPNAMVYSLRLALDTCVKLSDDSSLSELENFLAEKRDFNKFLQAMEYVVSPKLYVEYYLREFLKNFTTDRVRAFDRLMKKLYPIDTEDTRSSLQGSIYRDIVAPYKFDIESIGEMPIDEIERYVGHLIKRFNETMKKHREKNELRYYSPWLNEYVGREIEVPGQYRANEKPTPRYHVKIVKIESTLRVMQSIRKPIRISVVANDGKNYRFLVKFGEDLRLDQRVEQIYDIMNEKLKSDPACSQRRLSIDTYQVFPLSGSLGLIQWIDATRTLREYINFSLNDNDRAQHRHVECQYEEWIKRAAPGKCSSIQYKESLLRYKADDVSAKMKELTCKIGFDGLRKTFVRLSTCMESYMSMRRNFTSTYATMCIGQWILGIGDRHLANTLITIESGRCTGIDFGSAFGGGIDQSVPELMPFRLTSQIKGLLEPFNEYDSMGSTMIHVIRALRNSKYLLLACLDVVAHEQLNWQEHVNKLSQETDNATADIKWLPAKKLRIVSKKLDGVKPSTITLEQLAERHSDEQYFSRYTAIIEGKDSDDNCKRSSMAEDHLSPEEQVQCLIEQATDLNIVGRTYVGWAPWL